MNVNTNPVILPKSFEDIKFGDITTVEDLPDVQVSVELITVEAARQLMSINTINRALKPLQIKRIVESLKNGKWKLNGATLVIGYDDDGTIVMVDGQNRCQSVIESGIPMVTLVVRGLHKSVFDTVDGNVPRSTGDTLASLKEKNYNQLAATLALVEQFKTNKPIGNFRYHTSEIIPILEKYPAVRHSVTRFNRRLGAITPAVMMACHYLFSEIDSSEADDFCSMLITGLGLTIHNPIYHLRERMIRVESSKHQGMTRRYIMALTIKAWNLWRKGEKCKRLFWMDSKTKKEAYPQPI